MWKVEILRRSGKFILVIYFMNEGDKNGSEWHQSRGQIECLDQTEVDKWIAAINFMNK